MAIQYTPVDVALRNAVVLRIVNGPTINFQFPPRITTDGRKGDWREDNMPGTEPVATYQKSGPREITLTWTYIVDGGDWTTTRIADIVRNVRGYFSRIQGGASHRNLVVMFKMWKLGGDTQMSCRFKGVDVKHSDTIVVPCNGGSPQVNLAYPLRTDITVDLRIWTKGGPMKKQDLEGLREDETFDWY